MKTSASVKKGQNRTNRSPGTSKGKARSRPKYVTQWERTQANKRRNVERQKRKCRKRRSLLCKCASIPAGEERR